MRTADVWDVPEDSTITAVANRALREMYQKAPNTYHYNPESAQRGRENAGRVAHERALARRGKRAV